MKLPKKIRVSGIALTVLLSGLLVWQISPTMNAQKNNEQNYQANGGDKALPNAPVIDQLDDQSGIYLNAGKINVKTAAAKSQRQAVGGFSGKRMHLVKFDGPIQPQWYKNLAATGLEVIDYIPNFTYLVYGDANQLQALQSKAQSAKSHIEWEGAYLDEYRLAPNVFQKYASGKSVIQTELFSIQLYQDDAVNKDTLAAVEAMQTAPVKSLMNSMRYVNLVVGLNEDGVNQMAARPDVISIQPYFEPKKLDERQDIILTGDLTAGVPNAQNYLTYLANKGLTQAQFDASNFVVNVSDSGIDNGTQVPNHFGLYKAGNPTGTSRVVYNRLEGTANAGSTIQAQDGHGNINSHIIGGFVPDSLIGVAPHSDAQNYRYGLGVAPFVKIGSSVIFDPGTFTSPNYPNLESRAYRDGARISSNSWGANSNTYTTDSQTYDGLVRDAQPATAAVPAAGNQEYVILFAAGNAGAGANTVGSPGTGKNVITVGAAENVQAFGAADGCGTTDAEANNANDIIGFSSRGPTSDGRKKPDIVGPGTHVSGGAPQASIASPPYSGTGSALAIFDGGGVCGGTAGSFFFPSGQQWYTASSGTSHSTPALAGETALMRQQFINQSLAPPSPAMTKALLSNSARYMTGVSANDSLPSNAQGMGEMSLNNFFDLFNVSHIFKDQRAADKFTATGQQRTIAGTIPDNTKPFKVTLAWTDKPGSTTGNAFVNNLDLEVTAGGQTYFGNVFTGANSVIGGTADTRNNLESVVLPAGTTGSFVIKTKATNIAGDGVPNDADLLDQDYSLVVYNANEVPTPVVQAGALTVTAESCAPSNGAVDPDETVTVSIPLSNVGTGNTTNLTATLAANSGVINPSGTQTYGALTAGGAAVSRPFTFTAAAMCGQTITLSFQLQDGAVNLGTVTKIVQIGGLGAASLSPQTTGNIAVAIPDPGSVEIPINVTQGGSIADLNVKVRANHTFDSDVVMDLVAPDGTTVNLVNARGGSGDNFGSGANDCSGTPTVFDDAAATAISAGTVPFAGSFRPETLLSAFNGKSLTGIWKLRVSDTTATDSGTVGCVTLDFSRQPYICCGIAGTPVIASGGAAALLAESVTPKNNAPDPLEKVTVNLPIINTGDGATRNLTGTLQATGGVLTPSEPQRYGAVLPGPAAVSRPFSFVAGGTCGSDITLTLALQDGATSYGTITYTMRLGTVSTVTQTFSNTAAIAVPGSGTGATTGAPANPYPSNIVVSGASPTFSKVTVSLNAISHTFPSDIDVLLVSPTGAKFILMSDVIGGTDLTGQTYTFDDAAAAALPSSGTPPATGTFKPTNIGTGDVFPAPAPAAPYLSPGTAGTDTLASAFGGINPNGTWSLYVVDDSGTDVGSIAGGWSLNFSTSGNVCNSQACALSSPPTVLGYDYDSDGFGVVNYPSFPQNNVAGSCGVLSYNPPSGTLFPVGQSTVTVSNALTLNESIQSPAAATTFVVNVLAPTAAGATVSGIVQTAAGRGISGAVISLTNSQGSVRTVRTNPFGHFRFDDVQTGTTYVANITAKNYRFAPQVLNLSNDATDLRFVAAR